jgi:hypothetical protein
LTTTCLDQHHSWCCDLVPLISSDFSPKHRELLIMTNHDRMWLWILLSMIVLPWWAAGGVLATLLLGDWNGRRRIAKTMAKFEAIKQQEEAVAAKTHLRRVK